MVDAALIEPEGVLFDTQTMREASLQAAIARHRTDEALDATMRDLIALTAEREFASRIATSGARLQPGALDFVREAVATTRLAIVARASRTTVDAMMRLAQLDEFFGVVVTADDVLEAKPSPDAHLLAISRLNRQRPLALGDVLAIEDGVAGIRAARAAGVRCAVVGPIPAFEAVEADALVGSLDWITIRALDELSRPRSTQ